MKRRRLLRTAGIGLAAVAGCLGRTPGDPGSTASPTDSPTARRTTSAPGTSIPGSPESPRDDGTPSFDDGPKQPPDRPETLTLESAREFAKTREYRHAYNGLWMNEHSEVHLDCEVLDAREVDARYEVVVSCTGYSNTGGDATGTSSPTVVHADYFTQVYTYVIGEDTLRRRRATEDEKER